MTMLLLLAAMLAPNNDTGADDKDLGSAPPRSVLEASRQEFVVLTTEPFWRAVVRGGEIVLEGPGQPMRRMKIERRSRDGAARRWHARDAGGDVIVSITAGECDDGMSDTAYAFSATLTVGGTAAEGCASMKAATKR